MRLIEEVRYASAFSFKYSPRPGTPAAEMEQVADDAKAERLARLQALVNAQSQAFNAGMTGLDHRRAVGEARQASRPAGGQVAVAAGGAGRCAEGDDRARWFR